MRKLLFYCTLFLSAAFSYSKTFSQYILNGSASQNSCNCYTLTQPINFQSGSVWNSNKISLANSFDFHFNVYLGCKDFDGADGIVFILQPISTSVGTTGEGMGFEGISPSVGITLDTWQNINRNDSAFDHISIQANGYVTHDSNPNNLTGQAPISATSANVEDCQWHVLRITWDASTHWLRAYFDGVLRVQVQKDLVTDIFMNDPMLYWGFSGATGGANNLQQFCTSLNPYFKTNLTNSSTCLGNPVVVTDSSESFTTIQDYFWDFGDGTTSTLQDPPSHSYSKPGSYLIKHAIKGQDGCTDTLKKTVNIGAKPIADLSLFDTCTQKFLGINNKSFSDYGSINEWSWWLDSVLYSTDSLPSINNFSQGSHQLKLAESTIYGCASDTVAKDFSIHPTPVVSITASDGCLKQPVSFSGTQIDNATNIIQWNWKFGDGIVSSEQDPIHVYTQGGMKTVHLTAGADDGCTSNDTTAQIHIEYITVNAGKDTAVQTNIPFSLNATWSGDFSGTPSFLWSPVIGLNSSNVPNPTALLQNDQKYYLIATTSSGCTSEDSVKIRVFDFPGVLVPNAFTPNHDGLNDILRPICNGIKQLDYFAIYDRWGQLVFKTNEMGKGWDGTFNGTDQSTGVYVWILSAEGYSGKKYQIRGTTTLIR